MPFAEREREETLTSVTVLLPFSLLSDPFARLRVCLTVLDLDCTTSTAPVQVGDLVELPISNWCSFQVWWIIINEWCESVFFCFVFSIRMTSCPCPSLWVPLDGRDMVMNLHLIQSNEQHGKKKLSIGCHSSTNSLLVMSVMIEKLEKAHFVVTYFHTSWISEIRAFKACLCNYFLQKNLLFFVVRCWWHLPPLSFSFFFFRFRKVWICVARPIKTHFPRGRRDKKIHNSRCNFYC